MDTQPLDPNVVNLAKAIRQTESGGNFQAQGKSGEYGAYQYMPDTWAADSQKYLGQSVDLKSATPEQQNEVAYHKILDLKTQGYNPGQIASIWNSGKPNWQGNVGTNAQGVAYNTPQYVDSVTKAYQQFKAGAQNPTITPNASSVDAPEQQPQTPSVPNDAGGGSDWLAKIADVVSKIFPGRQIGQDIGTLGGYLYTLASDKLTGRNDAEYYDISAPSPLQAAGDVAQGALMVGGGMPAGSAAKVFGATAKALPEMGALGRIGTNAALGGLYGATGAIAGGSTKPSDIGTQTAIGAGLGGVGGAVGEALSKVADAVPQRLIKAALPKLQSPENVDYALNKIKFGSLDSMISDSQSSINNYDNQIKTILAHPQYGAERVTADDITSGVLDKFPNYDESSIFSKLKTTVPTEASTIQRLSNGQPITLDDANTLRIALDKASYKTSAIDSPEVKAGKELASTVGNTIRDAVQTQAPDTAPVFSNYSKEIRLFRALQSAAKSEGKKKLISLRDILSIVGGQSLAGPIGAAGLEMANRFAESPTAKIGAAKIASKLAPSVKGAAKIAQTAGTATIGRIGANQQQTNP